jgi:hypothetical protein
LEVVNSEYAQLSQLTPLESVEQVGETSNAGNSETAEDEEEQRDTCNKLVESEEVEIRIDSSLQTSTDKIEDPVTVTGEAEVNADQNTVTEGKDVTETVNESEIHISQLSHNPETIHSTQ